MDQELEKKRARANNWLYSMLKMRPLTKDDVGKFFVSYADDDLMLVSPDEFAQLDQNKIDEWVEIGHTDVAIYELRNNR